eukprot:PhF_6_TR13246/c0_g1_i1/m.20993
MSLALRSRAYISHNVTITLFTVKRRAYSETVNSSSEPEATLPPAIPTGVPSTSSGPRAIVRIQRLPLILIEEMPPPIRIMTEIELLTHAWSEEQAQHLRYVTRILQVLLSISGCFFFYLIYAVLIGANRKIRGTQNVPAEMRIGCVVYLDIAEEGKEAKRVVIGLFTDQCPLYCEYFHRMCTGNTPDGRSFRNESVGGILTRHVVMFGKGTADVHPVPDFDPMYLPEEAEFEGAWRGGLSAMAYNKHKQSPNFCIHMAAGDYAPQMFGIVLGGYEVVERIQQVGGKHGGATNRSFVIEGCGELCTLDKQNVVPLPWALYKDVSYGYDTEKFAENSSGYNKPLDWGALLREDNARVLEEMNASRKSAPRKKWLGIF